MIKITFFALIILCVVCLVLFATTTLTNGGVVYKTFATHPDTPPSGGLLLWAKTDGTFQTTNSIGTDSGMGGGGGGGVGPIVSAYNTTVTADQPNGSWNVVTFDTNDAALTTDASMHSTSSNTSRFIAPIAGYYSASCSLILVNASSFFAKLRLNGTAGPDVPGSGVGEASGATNPSHRSTTHLHMNANDYVECLFNPSAPDHPAAGQTWIGANFQLLKLP